MFRYNIFIYASFQEPRTYSAPPNYFIVDIHLKIEPVYEHTTLLLNSLKIPKGSFANSKLEGSKSIF